MKRCRGPLALALVYPLLVHAQATAPKADEPPAYEDKLIDSGNLAPLPPDDRELSYNPAGLPREWRVEGFASQIDQAGRTRHENGLVLSTRLETLEYGAYTLDATVRGGGSQSVVTLWQRALPFDNGWRANNGLGMLNTPAIDLSRQQFRFYLPTFPIAGLTTEWLHGGDVQLQASVGVPGIYDGLRVAGFTRLDGTVFTGGAQWSPSPGFQAGIQVADARGVQVGTDPAAPTIDGRSVYGAFAWQGTGNRLQANVLDSEVNDGRHNFGAWIDGEIRDGRYRHNYGIFRFEPNMAWGYTPINADLLGGYYRVNYQSQQWIWGAGVDSVSSVTGKGLDGTFLTGNARYQVDTTLGVGGGASFRHTGSDASAVYAFVDKRSFLGTSRVQVDAVNAEGAQRGAQIAVDHAWPTQVGLRISTSLSFASETNAGVRTTRSSLAAFGGIDITNNLSIEGNLRWSIDREDRRTTGTYANVGLVWRMSPRWSLIASYYDNRSESQPFETLAPLVPVEAVVPVVRDRAIFFTVRYEDHAGTPVAPLGGAPGSGAGIVVGYIWYDANEDGRRAANEAGAANVTVILDGKFATRTNNDGKFEFPFVAAGTHSIIVMPDNLALPFAIEGEGRRDVVVRTRETTSIDIPATKLR
ncbi:MAG: hypothetical protein ACXWHB_05875 [Usitatibacter sp.]